MRAKFIIVLVGLIVCIICVFSGGVIAQSVDLGLNGSWDLQLKDTETRHAQLELHQVDKTIFGAGDFISGEAKQRVTVAGSPGSNGVRLYLLNDSGNALMVLQFKPFTSRYCKECFEGNYSVFFIDGTRIRGNGSMSKINPDWAQTTSYPMGTSGFIFAAAQLANSSASKTTSIRSGNGTSIVPIKGSPRLSNTTNQSREGQFRI